jgi:hypothetical protein
MSLISKSARVLACLSIGLLACTGSIGEPGTTGTDPTDPTNTDPEIPFEETGPRPARRTSAAQLRAALVGATGFDYIGRERVTDPSAPQGSEVRDDAPLLVVYAPSLGEADYNYVVQAALDPSITFSKIVEDGVRFACERVATEEVENGAHPSGQAHLLFEADGTETPSDEGPLTANISKLALYYWGHQQSVDDPETRALLPLYQAGWESWEATEDASADEARARAALGWRTVCIAMLSDPRFLTY